MSNIINLEEIILAKKVVKDFPEAIQNLDICINLIYNKKEYYDISKVIQQIEESKFMMELILEVNKVKLGELKSE